MYSLGHHSESCQKEFLIKNHFGWVLAPHLVIRAVVIDPNFYKNGPCPLNYVPTKFEKAASDTFRHN